MRKATAEALAWPAGFYMVTVRDKKSWIAWCVKCKLSVFVQFCPMPKEFICWECGGPDLRAIPGAEVYI